MRSDADLSARVAEELRLARGAGAQAAGLVGWPTPAGECVGAPEPFEVAVVPTPWPDGCLPAGMDEAARAIADHAQAPAALAGMAVVAAVAHVAMRLVDGCHPKTGAMPASLYILTAGGSGDRKSEAFRMSTKPIALRERELRERHKASVQVLEAEAAQAKPADRERVMRGSPHDPRTIYTEATTQRIERDFVSGSEPALSLSTDEGGALFGGHSLKSDTRASSLSALTKLFDGGGVHRDRIGEGQSGFRFGVRFGLFLSAQPVVLHQALSDPLMRGQGFLPRFLYAAPESLAGSRLQDMVSLRRKPEDDPRVRRYWQVLQGLDERQVATDEHGGLAVPTVGLTEQAVEVWLAAYNDIELRQGDGGDLEALGAFASRAGELAARLAAVYACWRYLGMEAGRGDVVVRAADMQQAVALVQYSLREWQRQSAGATLSRVEVDGRCLLEWLHRKGQDRVTRSNIAQHCPNPLRKDRERRDAAISELIRRRWLLDGANQLTVIKARDTAPATATPAIPATPEKMPGAGVSSKNSGSSSSRREVMFSLPRQPARAPASVGRWAPAAEGSGGEGVHAKKGEHAGTDSTVEVL